MPTTPPDDEPIARALHALAPHAAARVPDDLAARAARAALSTRVDEPGLVDALLSVLRPVAALSTAVAVAALLLTGASSTSDAASDPIASLVDEHLDVDALVAARYAAVDVTEGRAP